MHTLLKKSWLHFLMIGLCLYSVQQWQKPPDITLISPPSEDKLAELRGQWLRNTGRPPSKEQFQQLLDNEINQQILFLEAIKRQWHWSDIVVRQRLVKNMRFLNPDTEQKDEELIKTAVAMGLHKNDLIVRRRLIQRMEMQAYATVQQSQPDPAILRQRFQQTKAAHIWPPTIHFRHIFISRDRHDDAAATARLLMPHLSDVSPVENQAQGDPFLYGFSFEGLNEKQIARYFGTQFAKSIFSLSESPQWQGPITSSFGEHLIWVEQLQAAEQKTFAEVERRLLTEWRREQEKLALQRLLNDLKQRYRLEATLGATVDA